MKTIIGIASTALVLAVAMSLYGGGTSLSNPGYPHTNAVYAAVAGYAHQSGTSAVATVTAAALVVETNRAQAAETSLQAGALILTNRATSLESGALALTNRATSLESGVLSLTNRATSLESGALGLTNRVVSLEAGVLGLTNQFTALLQTNTVLGTAGAGYGAIKVDGATNYWFWVPDIGGGVAGWTNKLW